MIHAAKASRALRLALVVALLTAAGAALALGLSSASGIDTLVDSSSSDYQATQREAQQFGAGAVVVLVHERLGDLLSAHGLVTISELEACLAGEQLRHSTKLAAYVPVPAAEAQPYGGRGSPCAELMRLRAAKVVDGPGTFLNRAVAAVNGQLSKLVDHAVGTVKQAESTARQLARRQGLDAAQTKVAEQQAAQLVAERQLKALGRAAQRAGIKGTPSIGDHAFVSQIVFGAVGMVKPRFADLFPDRQHALIQVRLRAGLTDAQQAHAIKLVRAAIRMPSFRLSGGGYVVTGQPVVLSDLASGIAHQALLLLVGAVVVMAIVLWLIFRRLRRLLPLALALATVAITFGLAALLGFTLTDGFRRGGARADRARRRLRRAASGRHPPTVGVGRGRRNRRRFPGPAHLTGADGAELRPDAGARHGGRVRPGQRLPVSDGQTCQPCAGPRGRRPRVGAAGAAGVATHVASAGPERARRA